MDGVAAERHVGPVRLVCAVLPLVREDRVARRIVAAGLMLRLAVLAVFWAWTVLDEGDELTRVSVAIVTAVTIAAWMSAAALAEVALLAALDAHVAGAALSARQGWAVAWARRRAIAGLVLTIRRGNFEWWQPSSAFALPVLATQDVDLVEVERQSVEVYRARWGEAEVEVGSPLAVGFVGGCVAAAIALVALPIGDPVWLIGSIIAVVLLVAAMTTATTLRAVLALAVYRHQVDGEAPFGLVDGELRQLVVPRTR